MIRYPRDRNAKLVIRFEVRSVFSCGYFLKYSHLAILAKLHCPYRVTRLTRVYCICFINLLVQVAEEDISCVVLKLFIILSDTLT